MLYEGSRFEFEKSLYQVEKCTLRKLEQDYFLEGQVDECIKEFEMERDAKWKKFLEAFTLDPELDNDDQNRRT